MNKKEANWNIGYLIFANFPDLWTWIGAAIIIASGLYIALRERRRRAEAIAQGEVRHGLHDPR